MKFFTKSAPLLQPRAKKPPELLQHSNCYSHGPPSHSIMCPLMKLRWPALLLFLLFGSPTSLRVAGVDYAKEIKPLLRERCYSCHGALKQKKDLRLDTVAAMLKGSSEGPVVVPNNPGQSRIIKRVTATDPEERMPPEHEGQPFTAAQVQLLRDWIAAGALAPENEKGEADPKDHWAFRQCARPPLPLPPNPGWVRNPIDSFIAEKHAQHGLTPQPEAPREIQLRRLYLDLIGLPPTAEEIASVKQDSSSRWYEETVDRLLDDPRYGERWGRHWMDIWRYSDWYGLGDQLRSSQKHIWHWRDWIIQSLNSDTPYDEMVRLMLAADETHPNDLEKVRATGFLARNYFLFNRTQWLEETVEHVSKAFLGLTINCAKCHDHKYDPIRQTDFYQMRAFFEPYHVRVDVLPGEPDLSKDGIPRVFDALNDTPTYRFIRGQESQPDKTTLISAKPPEFLTLKDFAVEPVSLPVEAYQPERRAWVLDGYLEAAQKKLRSAEGPLSKARETLIAALRKEANVLEAQGATASDSDRSNAKVAVDDARAALNVAETRFAFAGAELASVERRAEAMRASWAGKDDPEKIKAAIKAEREAIACKARLTLAEAEQRLLKASKDKKEGIAKEVKEAGDAVEKTRQTAQAAIKPEEKYAELAGAKWTPTRFLNSTADDPTVKFLSQSTGRRTALAKWITDRRNPLTARVAVNHIWARHFGTPLVPTVFDFGRKGTPPTHPELLDWLAVELMENGWSMKHIHRLIVTSATYRISSSLAGSEASAAKDPDNVYLWRRNAIRLEAEAVRDSMLALSGTLDPAMWGPPVPPENQEDSKRRSIYFFHSNNDRNLFLTTFDAAAVKECYRRDQSIVPQQALAMSNSKLALDSADLIAARLSTALQSPPDDQAFIRQAMSRILAVDPNLREVAACQNALETWRKQGSPADGKKDPARAHLIWVLLNHNDFVTLR